MLQHKTMRSRLLIGAALAIAAVATSCSKNAELPAGINSTLPANTGYTCTDPKGDISADANKLGGNLSAPAGIDLLAASAKLTDNTLKVDFEVVGPIAGTPQPEFILDQGQFGQTESFELKVRESGTGQGWELALTTWQKDNLGRVDEVPGKILSTPVKVESNKVSYEVSQKDIPKVLSYQWYLGATSGAPTALFDDCAGAADGSTSDAGTTAPTSSTTPPTTQADGSLRQSLTTKRGETVTVYSVESPPESPQAGATPADPAAEPLPGEAPPPPFKLAVIDAKVCAPTGSSLSIGAKDHFFVKVDAGENRPAREVAVSAHDPAFPFTGITLGPNECKQGWVTLQILDTETVKQVIYTVDANGVDALLWNV